MKRDNKRIVGVIGSLFMALWAGEVLGGSWAVLRYTEISGTGSGMCWRSWAVMDVTNKVQGVCDVANDGIQPPTTNEPLYLAQGDELSVNSATPPAVGYINLSYTEANRSKGRVGGVIEGTSWQPRLGLYRIFSDYTITGAAYYYDGPSVLMDAVSPPTMFLTGAWAVSVVNPAYVIPGFGIEAPADGVMVYSATTSVMGVVGTSPAGGNNQLEDGMVSVRWENVTLGTNGYVGVRDGRWEASEVPLEVGLTGWMTNELRFIAVGISPRMGLPVSSQAWLSVVAVAEPSTQALLGCVLLGWVVRKDWRRTKSGRTWGDRVGHFW